jgi:GT2 family glycosyltransferase
VATARNRGLAALDPRSTFVALLDSDDLWVPDTLARLRAALDLHSASPAAHGFACCIDETGQLPPGDDLAEWMRSRQELRGNGLTTLGVDEPTTFGALVLDNWVVTPGTMLIRRSALERVGRFDPSTAPADDWDFVVRVSRLGPLAFVDHQVLWWRRHGSSLSETSPNWRRAHFRVRDKMLVDPSSSPADVAAARAAYRRINRSSWREVLTAVTSRQPRQFLHGGARALYGDAHYARSVARASVARLRRR